MYILWTSYMHIDGGKDEYNGGQRDLGKTVLFELLISSHN